MINFGFNIPYKLKPVAWSLVTLEVEELVLLDLSIFVNNADLAIAALVLLSVQNSHPTVSTDFVE